MRVTFFPNLKKLEKVKMFIAVKIMICISQEIAEDVFNNKNMNSKLTNYLDRHIYVIVSLADFNFSVYNLWLFKLIVI